MAIGALLQHYLNIMLSIVISRKNKNECNLYFINIFMDCTIGVLFTFFIMKLIKCFSKFYGFTSIKSGLYYDIIDIRNGKNEQEKIKMKMYFVQLLVWVVAVVIVSYILMLCVIDSNWNCFSANCY
jgi:hypothetical protein